MKQPKKPKNPVQLAVVGAAQGLRGEVRVKTFTEDPMALGRYGPLTTGDGRVLTVQGLRMAKTMAVARFAEVTDRTGAEALNGAGLYVDRSALPADLAEDEYYHADLIGLAAVDESGARLGRIVAIHDFGAGDVLEIAPPAGDTVMVPFTRAAVTDIDRAAGVLRIDSRAAGLGTDDDPEPDEEPGS